MRQHDNNSVKRNVALGIGASSAILGAAGTAMQNATAFTSFLTDTARLGMNAAQGVGIALGGFCSGVVNLCVNMELIQDFLKRKIFRTDLTGWRAFRYYAGAALFIGTGILFGMTAFAFAPSGPMAMVGIAAGVFVALIMVIQELETWFKSFDPVMVKEGEEAKAPLTLKQSLQTWWQTLSSAKAMGFIISVGNVLGLSLLFAAGIASVLVSLHVAPFTALVASLTVSFTAGAFTEFYFYNYFLSNFCGDFVKNWKALLNSPYAVLGITSVVVNTAVNSILTYAGITLLNTMLASAGLGIIPLPLMIVASAFTGVASFILGSDFWIRNSKLFAESVSSLWASVSAWFRGYQAVPAEVVDHGFKPKSPADNHAYKDTNDVMMPAYKSNSGSELVQQVAAPR